MYSKTERLTDRENEPAANKRGMVRGGKRGTERYKLLCIKLISNKDTTQDYSHCIVVTLNGVKEIKMPNHCAAHIKLTP